jgi:hypothetical protein
MTVTKKEVTVEKNEVVVIPKWLLIYLIPFLTAMITGIVNYKVFANQMEMEIIQINKEMTTMQRDMDKKVNAAEVNIQFLYIIDDLKIIKTKLNINQEGLQTIDRNNK